MLKLLIVDDEKLTRDSLSQYLPFRELGIGEWTTARNGVDAASLLEAFKPDIALCDIRMPKMNGIEFGTTLRRVCPSCKIIYISAFADKEYLKSAIKLGAVSYIEKPIQLEELIEVLKNTVTACLADQQSKDRHHRLENDYRQSLPYIRQKLLRNILDESTPSNSNSDDLFRDPDASLPIRGACTFLHGVFNWRIDIEVKEQVRVMNDLLHRLYECPIIQPGEFMAAILSSSSIAMIFPETMIPDLGWNETSQQQLMQTLLQLTEGICTISIGIQSPLKFPESIPSAARQAAKTSLLQFYFGTGRFYRSFDFKGQSLQIESRYYTDFYQAIRVPAIEAAKTLVEKITQQARASMDEDLNHVRNIYFKLLMALYEVSRERNLIHSLDQDDEKYLWQEIAAFSTLEELSDYLTTNLEEILDKSSSRGNASPLGRKIENIKAYIQQHFSEKELSVQSIADHVYLSHTYLCALFKKSTGCTVNEYITQVRMDRAKELLVNSDAKLYDIALQVGLTDPNYFCSVFKKHAGYTPSNYRERFSN